MEHTAENFSFSLIKTRGKARAGVMVTPHGRVQTPVFMPVGTQATVKSLDITDLTTVGAEIILGNAYHLYLRPGIELLQTQGGLHQFMGWPKAILTDSGGFQVFSLASSAEITNAGVTFKSHIDGSKHHISPEKSIAIQQAIGADIIMAFDQCTQDQATQAAVAEALDRTYNWAQRSFQAWQTRERHSLYGKYQALFGIIQGGMVPELRVQAARQITQMDFDGIAIGGETIGFNMAGTQEVLSWIEHILPQNKPRYTMGLGRDPQDLVDAVLLGIDMCDCVGPTRLARNGALYHGSVNFTGEKPFFESEFDKGRLSIGAHKWAQDSAVIQADCDCMTCQAGYSRAYLHHLYKTKELTYYRLASIHNVRCMIRIMEQLRSWILHAPAPI